MVTMSSPDGRFVSIKEACELSGATDGLVRRYLRDGRLEGFKANERAWLVDRLAAIALRERLAPHSNVRKAERAAEVAAATKARKRRKTR